jgi:hypothetical protein
MRVSVYLRAAAIAPMLLLFGAGQAHAELIKCKVEESRIVFHLDIAANSMANVSIGTLTTAPKLAYKNVPVHRDDFARTIEAEASPLNAVSAGESNGCVVLKKEYYLKLWPKGATNQYLGDLEITPSYQKIPDANRKCSKNTRKVQSEPGRQVADGMPAPEIVTEVHKNVFCLKSGG